MEITKGQGKVTRRSLFFMGTIEEPAILLIVKGNRTAIGVLELGNEDYVSEIRSLFKLPQNVDDQILQDLSRKSGVPIDQLKKIVKKITSAQK